MPIITYLGSTVKEYKETVKQKLEGIDIRCPKHPEERLIPHAQYERGIKQTGEKIRLYRFICPKCKGTATILPDFLLPYKQYSVSEIEKVMKAAETSSVYDIDTEASVYTVRRWLKMERPKLVRRISLLKALAHDTGRSLPSEVELAVLTLIEQVRSITACLPRVLNSGNMLSLAHMLTASRYAHISPC
jgi:hypothetical protein